MADTNMGISLNLIKEIAKMDGDTKTIDSAREKDTLARLLANSDIESEDTSAFQLDEKSKALSDAYQKVFNLISEMPHTEGKDIKKEVETILKQQGEWNDYTEKVLSSMDSKMAAAHQARTNNVYYNTIQDNESVMKVLGNKAELLLALNESGLIKKTDDNKWDLSELSGIIGDSIGADYKLNSSDKKDIVVSEGFDLISKLRAITGLDISGKDMNSLVKLCGYEIENKHRSARVLDKTLSQINSKDITFDNSKDLAGQLPEGVTIDASGSIHIDSDILTEHPRAAVQLAKLGLSRALIGIAIGSLSELKEKNDTPVLSTNFTETTYETYVESLNSGNPKYAQIGMLIAAAFVDENGNWDREGYKDFLNKTGGDASLINQEELIGGLLELLNKE